MSSFSYLESWFWGSFLVLVHLLTCLVDLYRCITLLQRPFSRYQFHIGLSLHDHSALWAEEWSGESGLVRVSVGLDLERDGVMMEGLVKALELAENVAGKAQVKEKNEHGLNMP